MYLIFKKVLFFNANVGFVSFIDCDKLTGNEKIIKKAFGVPNNYKGIFINDMVIGNKQKHKCIGTQVMNKLFESKNLYLLDPVDDGIRF